MASTTNPRERTQYAPPARPEFSSAPAAPGPDSSGEIAPRVARSASALRLEVYRTTDFAIGFVTVVLAFLGYEPIAGTLGLGGVPARAFGMETFTPSGTHLLSFGTAGLIASAVGLWYFFFVVCGAYAPSLVPGSRRETAVVVVASGLGTIAIAFLGVLSQTALWTDSIRSTTLVAAGVWLVSAVASLMGRWAVAETLARPARAGAQRVLIVGSGGRARRLAQEMREHPETGVELLGFVDSGSKASDRDDPVLQRFLGPIEGLDGLLMRTVVDRVLVALPVRSHYSEIQEVIDACARGGVECRYPVDVFQARFAGSLLETSGPAPCMRLPAARRDGRHSIKRAIDMLGATGGILLLSPLLLAIALSVSLTSKGPPIFVQERYGFGKRRFQMFKFRTMVCEAESLQLALEAQNEKSGPIFKIRDDPRVTPLGRFLRSTSLDELPQLLNVLRGEMSLVGPRPMSVRDVGRFDEPWLMRRFSVHPGLTCLWQVSGRSNLTFDDWIALDLEYIDNWSLSLDARIIARTLPAICCRVGAV